MNQMVLKIIIIKKINKNKRVQKEREIGERERERESGVILVIL